MRLHRLRVTAFQAFAGSEEVDFDALAAAGLFLLHGDTGAGKTTLLDAVCFALYGEVPGARSREARLRSDHADPSVRTEVELDVTLRGRRLRIVRRPRQERPKVRGEGSTEEGHACTVQELRDGEWTTLAARPDEARAELADPLGMSCEQFCQVVLLPQGEFAAFLRAGSDERWRLLERLFGTERFTQVEWWLRDRRIATRAELQQQLQRTRDVVSRLSQAAGEPEPDGWDAEPAAVGQWAGGLSVTAEASAATAQEAAADARGARVTAERALTAGSDLAARRERHATAVAELAAWSARRDARDAAERELLAARRAAPIAALIEAADARALEAAAAQHAADAAWEALDDEARAAALAPPRDAAPPVSSADPQRVGPSPAPASPAAAPTLFDLLPDPPDPSPPDPAPPESDLGRSPCAESTFLDPGQIPSGPAAASGPASAPLRAHAAGLRGRAGALAALVAVEQRLAADRAALAELAAEADAARATAATAAAALAAAGAEARRLDAVGQAARTAADRLDALAAEARTAIERAARAQERDRLAIDQTAAQDAVRVAVDAEQTARTAWLELRERRLSGIAAELATGLASGEPCAVCGALEHPAPARHAAEAAPVDAATERAAQERHAARADVRTAAEQSAARVAQELAAAQAVAGDEPAAALRERAEQLTAEVGRLSAQAAQLEPTEAALRALTAEVAEQETRRRAAEQAETTARAARAERESALTDASRQLQQARAGAPTVAARAAALTASADACDICATALEHAARARIAHAQAAAAAESAAREAGFLAAAHATPAPGRSIPPHPARSPLLAADPTSAGLTPASEQSAAPAPGRRTPSQPAAIDGPASSFAAGPTSAGPAPAPEQSATTRAAQPRAAAGPAPAPEQSAETATQAAQAPATAAARAAVRSDAAQEALDRRLRAFDDGLAQRKALADDAELSAAASEPAPDIAALRAAAQEAEQADAHAHARLALEQRRRRDVAMLATELDEALEALAPVAERERSVRELAALVDGSSTSNRLRMRLSAYVLAARLEEVAEAATARLERMSNGRYALVHSDGGAKGRRRGGLDLAVLDGWTGSERAPSTLSGGETFLASLALALGLADVVAADAGGSRLETLFIDEGFGSLDERTLDLVMDALDTLREGGRAVGIVSHVAELRQRIPAKLHVVKGRDGSHVVQETSSAAA